MYSDANVESMYILSFLVQSERDKFSLIMILFSVLKIHDLKLGKLKQALVIPLQKHHS